MAISKKMNEFAQTSSWIRKMFEEGARLKAEFGAENVFDFSLGNPDLSPPPEFQKTLVELAFVREAVAARISTEQDVTLSADEMLMTCGAAGGLNVTLKALLDPGDEVIILAPFFVEYKFYVDNHGGVSKVVSTDDSFDLDLGAIEAAVNEKTKAIIINSPNNPTGQIYSQESLAALGKVLSTASQKYSGTIFLIADEPYRKIVFDNNDVPSIMQAYPNSIVVSSYSMPLVGALTLANRILGFVNAPALMQRVVAELQGASVDNSIYTRRREVFCKILADTGYEFMPPKGAFYVFPKSPIGDDVEFVSRLQDQKILAVPGKGFGAPGYFRLAFCVEDSVIERSAEAFRKAMESVKE
jgi:aspartate aminotransferase